MQEHSATTRQQLNLLQVLRRRWLQGKKHFSSRSPPAAVVRFTMFTWKGKRKLFTLTLIWEEAAVFLRCDKPGLFWRWRQSGGRCCLNPLWTISFLWSLDQCGSTNTEKSSKRHLSCVCLFLVRRGSPCTHPPPAYQMCNGACALVILLTLGSGGGEIVSVREPADTRRVRSLPGHEPFTTRDNVCVSLV